MPEKARILGVNEGIPVDPLEAADFISFERTEPLKH